MAGSRIESVRGDIQPDTGVSKHRQLVAILREHAQNVCRPGQAIPSERELTQRFGVARMTVRHAIDSLVEDGVLERVIGVGTFVARPKMETLTFTRPRSSSTETPDCGTMAVWPRLKGAGWLTAGLSETVMVRLPCAMATVS